MQGGLVIYMGSPRLFCGHFHLQDIRGAHNRVSLGGEGGFLASMSLSTVHGRYNLLFRWWEWAIPEKIQMMTMGYSRKKSNEGCNTCWNFKGQKPRPMEILHEFFLNLTTSLGNSTSFYFNWCWEFLHALSLVTLETPCLQQPICLEFWSLSGIAQWRKLVVMAMRLPLP